MTLRLKIPTPITPFFTLGVNLEGTKYLIHLRWNTRDGWYLGLKTGEDVTILSPVKLVPDYDILRDLTEDSGRPPGSLFLIDQTGNGEYPGFDDLKERHALLYFTAEELAAIVEADGTI